jgi:hypothetical protein
MSDTRDHPMANAMNRPFVPQTVFLRIHIYPDNSNHHQQRQQQQTTMNEQTIAGSNETSSTTQEPTVVNPASFIDTSMLQSMIIPLFQFNDQDHSTNNTDNDTVDATANTTTATSSDTNADTANTSDTPFSNHQMPLFIIPWFSTGIGNDGRHYFSLFIGDEWQNINDGGWSMTGHPPAAAKVMHTLPTRLPPPNCFSHKTNHNNDGDDHIMTSEEREDCAICQDPLFVLNNSSTDIVNDTNATTVREMPCGHAFHESCLFPWLRRSNTCPCCRWELDTDNIEYNRVIHRRRSECLAQMGKLPCSLTEFQYCIYCDTTTATTINSDNDEDHPTTSKSSNDANEGVTSPRPEMIILPECGCGFHRVCLSEFLRSVYNIDISKNNTTTSTNTTALYCPACHQHQEVATEQLIV